MARPVDPNASVVGRQSAIAGFAAGVASAILAVFWIVAIPLGIVAVVLSWRAAHAARGRDGRSVGFAIGGLTAGTAGLLLGLATALWDGDSAPPEPVTINGIETSTPDALHPPQSDLEPGTKCTTDLDGLRAEGTLINRTAKAHGYRIKIVWNNEGTQLAEATALLDPVAPGASAPFVVASPVKGTVATTCSVVEIDRRSS